jgi:alpha-galactosidase
MTKQFRLLADGVQLVLEQSGDSLSILHWGSPLGDNPELAKALTGSLAHADFDERKLTSIYREQANSFLGAPVLEGHRAGSNWSQRFAIQSVEALENRLVILAKDEFSELEISTEIELSDSGVLLVGHTLRNLAESEFTVNSLTSYLPLPDRASQVMDFSGRWSKERQPQRQQIQTGSWIRESREGRSSHDYTIIQLALTEQTNFQAGEVWSVGLMWSGNTRHILEKLPDGSQSIGAGELLLPGEIVLAAGQSYAAPKIAAAYSKNGIDDLSNRYHRFIRSLKSYPTKPRPLTLNVWEAVFFDHNLEKLSELVEVAADIGVERVVLDDGWFGSRRDDTKGLGDWQVSNEVWPKGLGPLVSLIRSKGMQFGLWFEGEMINPDSDTFRAHPDWVLQSAGRIPPLARHQLVLDLTNPAAFDYVFDSVNQLVAEYQIDYIKWDHNRVLTEASNQERAAIRNQTLAIYRMFDDLKAANPGLEIESCASGGGRVDLGMVLHADRFWTSDNNDPLERQQIQRYSQFAIPPELLGSHIGPTKSHQTHRVHSLNFRAITALFGHAGIEWDLTQTNSSEREVLTQWAKYYKANRSLIHSGKLIRLQTEEPSSYGHGVVSVDQSQALFSYVQLSPSRYSHSATILFAGLDPEANYSVRRAADFGDAEYMHRATPAWFSGVQLSGAALMEVGLKAPLLAPENAILIELSRN